MATLRKSLLCIAVLQLGFQICLALGRLINFSNVGCFVDSTNDVRDVSVKDFGIDRVKNSAVSYDPSPGAYWADKMTQELCATICSLGGFRFMALQSWIWCACGDSYGSQGAAPASQCSSRCNGNGLQRCGGDHRNGVFRINYLVGECIGGSMGSGLNPVRDHVTSNIPADTQFVPGDRSLIGIGRPEALGFRTLTARNLIQCAIYCRAGCEAVLFIPETGQCNLLEFAAVPTALSNSSTGKFFVRK